MKKLATSTLFLAVLLSSCYHYYYVSNVQNVPLFREKDEFRISAHYGGGPESVTREIQTAYGLTFNWLDVAFSTRPSSVTYTNIDYSIYEDPYISEDLESLSGKGHFFIEPGITLRIGWNNIKAQVQ